MDTLKLVLSIVQILGSLFLIGVVLLQSGRRAGLSGSISGMADTFLSRNKAKTLDAKLEKLTIWVSIGFVALTLSLSII
jgi:preprotein translocase subunit SecG